MCASFCNTCIRIVRKRAVSRSFSITPKHFAYDCMNRRAALLVPQIGTCPQLISSLYNNFKCFSTDTKPATSPGNQSGEASSATGNEEPVIAGPSEQLMQSLSDSDQHKMKVMWLELDVFRQQGNPVPYQMSDQQWKEAAEMPTRSQRLKFYRFLCIRNARREREKQKKAEKREAFHSHQQHVTPVRDRDLSDNSYLQYGLNLNTIFLRLRDTTINFVQNHWQCQGIMFGQALVVDLGYDEHMVNRECTNCADQIKDMYAFNKLNRQPFHLYLCNANPKDRTLQHLEKFIPNIYSHNCLMTITEKSYLELFPKKNIVYLTPHCKQELLDYDHDAVYIIGGMVDKSTPHPVSLAKAKKEGLRMARLPFDHYLEWGTGGNKSLTLDQMMKIMLDIKNTGDWLKALEHVPKRKLRRDDEYQSPKTQFFSRHRRSLFEDR